MSFLFFKIICFNVFFRLSCVIILLCSLKLEVIVLIYGNLFIGYFIVFD